MAVPSVKEQQRRIDTLRQQVESARRLNASGQVAVDLASLEKALSDAEFTLAAYLAAEASADAADGTVVSRAIDSVRRGVDSATQGLKRWSDRTEEQPNVTDPVKIDLGGRKVSLTDSSTPYYGARVRTTRETQDDNDVRGVFSDGRIKQSRIPVPNRTHFTREGKAFITIRKRTGLAGSGEVNERFDQFILTAVTEQSVEKLDVVETFGAPHVFASGKYVTKVGISGYVRNVARNGTADARSLQSFGVNVLAEDAVADSVQLQVFYNKYLRATELAERGAIATLTVDGDTYEGFFQDLSFQRDSSLEQVTPFTMQMIALTRRHRDQSNAEAALKRFDKITERAPRFTDKVAAAHLDQALGKIGLAVGEGEAPTATALIDGGGDSVVAISLGDIRKDSGRVMTGKKLFVAGAQQLLTVSGGIPGLSLTLNGNDVASIIPTWSSTQTAVYSIGFKVVDYAVLLQAKNAATGVVTGNYVVSTSSGKNVTVQVNGIAASRTKVNLKSVDVQVGDVLSSGRTGNPLVLPLPLNTPTIAFKIEYILEAETGNAFDLNLTDIGITVDSGPGDLSGSLVSLPADRTAFAGASSVAITAAPRNNTYVITVSGTYSPSSIITNDNPFKLADGILFIASKKVLTDPTSTFDDVSLPEVKVLARHPAEKALTRKCLAATFRAVKTSADSVSIKYRLTLRLYFNGLDKATLDAAIPDISRGVAKVRFSLRQDADDAIFDLPLKEKSQASVVVNLREALAAGRGATSIRMAASRVNVATEYGTLTTIGNFSADGEVSLLYDVTFASADEGSRQVLLVDQLLAGASTILNPSLEVISP